MSSETPADKREIGGNLATVETARRQVRLELSRGRRPRWFIAACAVTVGAAVASTSLPPLDARATMTIVLAAMLALVMVERKVVRLIPHRRRFTAATLGVALGVCGAVVTVAMASPIAFDKLQLPAPGVFSGATVAVTVAALTRPSLRWLGASLRSDDR